MKKIFTIIILGFLFIPCYSQLSFNLTGAATQLGNNCFQLTPNQTAQIGTAWFSNTIDLNNAFTIEFDGYWGTKDSDGADGMALVFSSASQVTGGIGIGIGYTGITPSLCIEFDTWYNSSNADITSDHIAIMKNGDANHGGSNCLSPPVQASSSSIDIEDGSWHIVKAIWEPNIKTISIYFDCVLRTTYTGDIVNTIFNGTSVIYWGFTSATGSASNTHQVCFNQVSFLDKLSDTTICRGTSVPIKTFEGSSYSWAPSAYLSNSNIQNPVATPDSTTTYYVSVQDKCGNFQTDSITITVIQPIDVLLPADTSICIGASLNLSASISGGDAGSISYSWDNNMGSNTSISVTPITTTSYKMAASDVCSIDSAIITVSVALSPVINIMVPDMVCAGALVTATASGGISYQWSGTETSNPLTFYPTTDTTLSLIATDASGCVGNASASITVNPLPSVDINGPTAICEGEPLVLTASGGLVYSWCTGSSTDIVTVTPQTDTSYFVSAIDANNCQNSDTVYVIVYPSTITTLSGDTVICEGNIATYTSSGGVSYWWGNGETQSSITAFPMQDSVINVIITDINNCSYSRSINVKVNPLPQPELGEDFELCSDESVLINPGEFETYEWQDYSNLSTFTAIVPGTYKVSVSNEYGCIAADSVQIVSGNCYSLYIPNSFTPNGDKKNDYFNAIGKDITSYNMTIYDRWGASLFSTDQIKDYPNSDIGWDGSNALIDAYIWSIDYTGTYHNRKITGAKKGVVYLIR